MTIIREGTLDDAAACSAVWASTQRDLPDGPTLDQPLHQHEAATGRLVVAELAGRIVGFGGTMTRSGVLYLADLFVRPEHQSSGIGRRIGEQLLSQHTGPMFTFASADVRAQHLYRAFGMRPLHPFHYLAGELAAVRASPSDVRLEEATDAEVLRIDRTITGRDRGVDVAHARSNGCTWLTAHRGERDLGVVGVGASPWNPWHPRGARLGPVLAHDPDDVPAIAAAAVAELAAGHHYDVITTFVSANHAVFTDLLHWGFEVIDTDVLMATHADVFDCRRYLPTVETP
jgi:GNAT superfamily N-acetyltransferase